MNNMIELREHHIRRLEEIAAVTEEPVAEVLTRAFCELGVDTTIGALGAWIWQERMSLGLEQPSHFHDAPSQISAWQEIEDKAETWPKFSVLTDEEPLS